MDEQTTTAPASVSCPHCGKADQVVLKNEQVRSKIRDFIDAHPAASAAFLLGGLPVLCASFCLITSLFNIDTYDQQDTIALSSFGLFRCGFLLALLWLWLCAAWFNTRRRERTEPRIYYCGHDQRSFVIWPELPWRYWSYYLLAVLPLGACLLGSVVLRTSSAPSPSPEPFPAAEVTIEPITSRGGSGGTYMMRSASYVVAEPAAVVRTHYEKQLPGFFMTSWAFEEKKSMWEGSKTCLYTTGDIKRRFPYQYQTFSLYICPQGEQRTEVHAFDSWNE